MTFFWVRWYYLRWFINTYINISFKDCFSFVRDQTTSLKLTADIRPNSFGKRFDKWTSLIKTVELCSLDWQLSNWQNLQWCAIVGETMLGRRMLWSAVKACGFSSHLDRIFNQYQLWLMHFLYLVSSLWVSLRCKPCKASPEVFVGANKNYDLTEISSFT